MLLLATRVELQSVTCKFSQLHKTRSRCINFNIANQLKRGKFSGTEITLKTCLSIQTFVDASHPSAVGVNKKVQCCSANGILVTAFHFSTFASLLKVILLVLNSISSLDLTRLTSTMNNKKFIMRTTFSAETTSEASKKREKKNG